MKAYTDIEQSKKLAKILSLESADMYYEEVCNLPKAIVGSYILHNQCMEDKDYKKLSNPVLSPAWSLSALLDILNKTAHFIDEDVSVNLSSYKTVEWDLIIINSDLESVTESNPIDACVAMIKKLHEFKML